MMLTPDIPYVSRYEAFRTFAQHRATYQVLVPPTMLSKEDRRLHIRQTLDEDHYGRVHNHPDGVAEKYAKLESSAFSFFRGTALLFYRDCAGTDGHLPPVLAMGDVHPENFGVMSSEAGVPIFNLNDFDEAYYAPFSWDVKRGAVGFYLAAREYDLSKKDSRKTVEAFVEGYLKGLATFVHHDREKQTQQRLDNSPKMIRELLKSAAKDRESFLLELVDFKQERFIHTDEVIPHSTEIDKFQAIVDEYAAQVELTSALSATHFKVKDVAIKEGSGTASLGLSRYWVLIEGPTDAITNDIILEIKQARTSAMAGLVPTENLSMAAGAARVVQAHNVHVVGGDPYYGYATIDETSFLVRERSPFKTRIKLDNLDDDGFVEYARICGYTLSQAHARSDEDQPLADEPIEKQILESMLPDVFTADIVRFAEIMGKRVRHDHKLFKEDYKLGAFHARLGEAAIS